MVGAKEQENGTVSVRTRDNKVHGERSIQELLQDDSFGRSLAESTSLVAGEPLLDGDQGNVSAGSPETNVSTLVHRAGDPPGWIRQGSAPFLLSRRHTNVGFGPFPPLPLWPFLK